MNARSLDYTISCSSPGWGYEFPAIGFYIMSATHRHTRAREPHPPQPRTKKRKGLAPPNTPTGRKNHSMADNAAQQKTETFADYGVRQDISDALAAVGITTPLPHSDNGAAGGAGRGTILSPRQKPAPAKPWALACPRFRASPGETTKAGMIWSSPAPAGTHLVPTRELAIQVGEDLAIASKLRNARVATLYGGVPYEPQVKLLKKGRGGCGPAPGAPH